MSKAIILASQSKIRRELLVNAGVEFTCEKARVDEDALRESLIADQASGRVIADTLAEYKARRVSQRNPEALVIGCDQILEHDGVIFAKPTSADDLREQLQKLRGTRHQLLSAAVIYEAGEPKWRHIGVVRLQMRDFSDEYLDGYISRNWDEVQYSVGGYHLEGEGVRLFSSVNGDYFNVLGLPLIELLSYLTMRGILAG